MTTEDWLNRWHKLWVPEPNTGCYIWIGTMHGGRGNCMHPVARVNGQICMPTRIICEAAHGSMFGRRVLRKCRIERCINPSHMKPSLSRKLKEYQRWNTK